VRLETVEAHSQACLAVGSFGAACRLLLRACGVAAGTCCPNEVLTSPVRLMTQRYLAPEAYSEQSHAVELPNAVSQRVYVQALYSPFL